jgi:hypothetical protein
MVVLKCDDFYGEIVWNTPVLAVEKSCGKVGKKVPRNGNASLGSDALAYRFRVLRRCITW